MTDYIVYYSGVYNPSAPQGNAFQSYAESTGKFTQWNPDGSIAVPATAMTSAQLALVASWDATGTAGATAAANQTTITTNLQANLTTITNWIAANPSGATLTPAQTLVVAKMLRGLCLLLLQQYGSTTGT